MIDGVTGELFESRLTPSHDHILVITSWLTGLPRPAAVAYAAGPTGSGLYRYLTAVGTWCGASSPWRMAPSRASAWCAEVPAIAV